MEGNRDEALRCLSIAQKHRDSANYPSARKFCQKSISLFDTPEAHKLLASINAAAASSSAEPSSSTSAAEPHPSSSGAKQRKTNNGTASGIGGEKREYSTENVAVVKRVRSCKASEYYEILELKRECEDVEVKKAYRKLALALHPDKNGAPGADEAFKMVSKAFQVLSDPQKRTMFDQSGSDPEDRTAGSGFSTSPFSRGGRGGGFEGELSPEDLFNMFFGGGGGAQAFGGGFGGGPVFTTSFGPGGFRTTSFGGQPQRQANNNARNADPRSVFLQLLPLFLLFGISLLSSLPNLFSTPPVPDPMFAFTPTTRYNVARHTRPHGITYHINPAEFMNHPVIGPELVKEGVDLRKASNLDFARGPAVTKFEGQVERVYSQEIYSLCQRGLEQKNRAKEAEIGVFGIGTDWEKVRQIDEEVIPSCEELQRLGIRR
ncbi:hypothetical protein C8J56DRAFT_972183 [Mycena floridula]|nr:hypothetical protein C8J56DRAFT_972183 [Mycena floridula]